MSYLSIGGITLVIALIVVFAIGFLSYMSNLLKSAYQLKVEMRAEMDSGLRKIEEEMGKKSRWMRSEIGEDVNKMKSAIAQDNDRRLKEISENLQGMVKDLERASSSERAEVRKLLQAVSQKITALESGLASVKEEQDRRTAIGRRRGTETKADAPPAAGPHPPGEDEPLLLDAPLTPTEPRPAGEALPPVASVAAPPISGTSRGPANLPAQRVALTDFGKGG